MSKIYTVTNETRGNTIADFVEKADNPWTRFIGLMGRPGIPDNYGLWIEPCADIHSCFMRFLFDAVFVDKTGTVMAVMENMKPWRCSPLGKPWRAVLELPGGAIAKTGLQVGDQLRMTLNP